MNKAQEAMFEPFDGATFSEDRRYRYKLWRRWDLSNKKTAVFVGLNPSTADEKKDDPTIRRVISFAKAWGCGGVYMMNLFAYVSTNPKELRLDDNREMNLDLIFRNGRECLSDGGVVVFAWGAFKEARERGATVAELFPNAVALEVNADGSPKHPLYVRGDIVPVRYRDEQKRRKAP
jgi:hypothetical protein